MKGSECRLIEYMEGAKKRFIIPVYQRNYDWKTENCKQLFDDFGKANKAENKKAYDALLPYKSEIESKLGTSLIWNRSDDLKASKVYYQLDGVSIENEVDWLQMARFHAEWSKKFYDIIVPYIKL